MPESSESFGYMVVIQDNESDAYLYGIPEEQDSPRVVYLSYKMAEAALKNMAEAFEECHLAAYGKAYPYENTTFEDTLAENGYATYGWGVVSSEEGVKRIHFGLLRVPLVA